ncbi:PREDICTED: uncharacterized oxidoreductase dhs-27-like [Nicrophorus vespilloides]|uniref:Uncharacterized oxidoreductase dhs-27-like n=1 Tax=Nicrophorus vespilloides TaxID=110193 RepID=A0ABM1MLG6_NICVS|nr:PREDICTED: uncharacterized oxidoreductase dhs-27-like [Nicrophorus vespilloides]XP_017775416.1 PREDICTED: uncharacterized oxidoreductase dhs-27-like [Nicrophorus vespilloides]
MSTQQCVTKELLEESFRTFLGDENIKILGYSVKAAVPIGDNYTSQLYRAQVTFALSNESQESMSVIIKIEFKDTVMGFLTAGLQFFSKEMEMFSKTLPLMYDALGPDYEGCLSSLSLLTKNEPNAILVLQDLQPLGFKMVPRQMGLDLEHCQMVMKKIAQFHAASVVVTDKDPSAMKNYSSGMYSKNDLVSEWMRKGVESLAESCLQWQGLEKYGAKMQKLLPDILMKADESCRKKLGGFNVINHGDLWVNNMLFSYHANSGKLKDLRFVDFQVVHYTSPAVDLHYFLATSPSEEVRKLHMETLLDSYYGHLLATLSNMNYSLSSVPSREEFRKDLNSRALQGLMGAATVAPLVRASHREDATFEDLMGDSTEGSFRHHCYTNEKFKKSMEQYIPYLDRLGALD